MKREGEAELAGPQAQIEFLFGPDADESRNQNSGRLLPVPPSRETAWFAGRALEVVPEAQRAHDQISPHPPAAGARPLYRSGSPRARTTGTQSLHCAASRDTHRARTPAGQRLV